jgi:hypothetical protein
MSITRRSFFHGAALATVAVAAPVALNHEHITADLTAIPTEVVEKIKAWQDAHRAAVRATAAYSASLRVKPIDKVECDRCWAAHLAAGQDLGPAREAMIMALWRVS